MRSSGDGGGIVGEHTPDKGEEVGFADCQHKDVATVVAEPSFCPGSRGGAMSLRTGVVGAAAHLAPPPLFCFLSGVEGDVPC